MVPVRRADRLRMPVHPLINYAWQYPQAVRIQKSSHHERASLIQLEQGTAWRLYSCPKLAQSGQTQADTCTDNLRPKARARMIISRSRPHRSLVATSTAH